MIKAIFAPDESWLRAADTPDWHGAIQMTRWAVYGEDKSSPRFWLLANDGQVGAASLGEDTLVFCGDFPDLDELAAFVRLSGAKFLRGNENIVQPLCEKLGWEPFCKQVVSWPGGERDFSEKIHKAPDLKEVFALLHQVFSLPDEMFSQWYWENSYKIRHGLGEIWTVQQGEKTACTAGIYHQNKRAALIGSVATGTEFRGKGYASALICALAQKASAQGQMPYIVCENRYAVQVYQKAGFVLAGQDFFAKNTEKG